MRRTRRRALPRHIVSAARRADLRRWSSGSSRRVMLALWVNWLSAVLAVLANAFYVLVYTMVLKRRTTQNIVWGGLAGCFPALIGWTAVTGELAWAPVVLFMVVFFWTPPHTWALALRYREDYAGVDVPMLPVVAPAAVVGRQIVALHLGHGRHVAAAVAGGRHRAGSTRWPPVVLGAVFLVEAHRMWARRAAPSDLAVIKPMRLFHALEPLPVAAVRRGRAGPADPLTRLDRSPGRMGDSAPCAFGTRKPGSSGNHRPSDEVRDGGWPGHGGAGPPPSLRLRAVVRQAGVRRAATTTQASAAAVSAGAEHVQRDQRRSAGRGSTATNPTTPWSSSTASRRSRRPRVSRRSPGPRARTSSPTVSADQQVDRGRVHVARTPAGPARSARRPRRRRAGPTPVTTVPR